MSRIVITGIGVVSSIGSTISDTTFSLKQGNCGITYADFVESKYAQQYKFGEVKIETHALQKELLTTEKGISRTSLLALHAFNQAIEDSKLCYKEISCFKTALIVANTVGGMCLTNELYHDANIDNKGTEYIASYANSATTEFLQHRYQIKGICNTINTACSSSLNAIMFGARLIQHGFADRAIVGGCDSLAKFTINGFNSLGILSSNYCKPFDNERNGLNLGEGAGFLILEKEADCMHKKQYASISGYSNTNDAYHASSLSPDGNGPYLAMKNALHIAQLSSNKIDFINTHGTGTENNDLIESIAMKRLFDVVPPFVSSKSKIGHSLGAAGCIETIFSLIAMQNQEIYPSLHFENEIPETQLIPNITTKKLELDHIMCNSFGFGGNCSSLILSKI